MAIVLGIGKSHDLQEVMDFLTAEVIGETVQIREGEERTIEFVLPDKRVCRLDPYMETLSLEVFSPDGRSS